MSKRYITRDLKAHADHVVISGSIHNELWAIEHGHVKAPHFNERRAYLRSLFSMVEGISFQLRHELLRLHKISQIRLSLEEQLILSEVEIRLEKGKARTVVKRYPADDLFRFTIHCYAPHLRRTEMVNQVFDETGRSAFKAAYKKRDSLTHPKTAEDTEVTDEEWSNARAARVWYNKLYIALLNESILEELPDKDQ